MGMSVCKTFRFDAAHYLPNYEGKCSQMHGHTWVLEVEVSGSVGSDGMVIDFAELKGIVNREVIDKLDHTLLNDTFENPTAENMLRRIWNTLLQAIGNTSMVSLTRLRLYETPDSFAEMTG